MTTPSKEALEAWDALSAEQQSRILCAHYDDVEGHWQAAFDAGRESMRESLGQPVAWCVAYDDPNLKRRIHSNPTMCKPDEEQLAYRTRTVGTLALVDLYAIPQPDGE